MKKGFLVKEVKEQDRGRVLGKVATMKDGNIAFKCGSPNACSQCGRCGNP